MLVTSIIFAIAISIAVIVKKKDNDAEFGLLMFLAIFTAIILSFLANMIVASCLSDVKYTTTVEKIVATKPTTRIEGEIRGNGLYFRGRIDEVDYYFYLVNYGGVYRQSKVEVENTVIKETYGTPCVKKVKKYLIYPIGYKIAFSPHTNKISESDTLFVPVGTIENLSEFEVF